MFHVNACGILTLIFIFIFIFIFWNSLDYCATSKLSTRMHRWKNCPSAISQPGSNVTTITVPFQIVWPSHVTGPLDVDEISHFHWSQPKWLMIYQHTKLSLNFCLKTYVELLLVEF